MKKEVSKTQDALEEVSKMNPPLQDKIKRKSNKQV